ncbi:MAG: hypothetical protein K2Y02_01960 [Burkholderiaceae bacterium]|nr:hypothetical protein [Burkholderiaceae bacterium]
MATETERRFLVDPSFDPPGAATSTLVIRQSYLPAANGLVVRLRETLRPGRVVTTHDMAPKDVASAMHEMETKRRLTGMTNEGERMSLTEAMYRSLRLGAGPEIVKLRHLVPHAGRTWEVDVYVAGNPDIPRIAEVEFDDERESDGIALPDWVTTEVTGDARYSNEGIAASMAGAPPAGGAA